MLRLLKIILLLLVIQIVSYWTISENKIDLKIMNELEIYAYNINHLGIYADRRFNKNQQEKIIEILKPKYGIIEFPHDINDYSDNHRTDSTRYGLSYDIEYEKLFIAKSNEENGTFYYGESWETKFVWLFYDWFLISKKCTGQS